MMRPTGRWLLPVLAVVISQTFPVPSQGASYHPNRAQVREAARIGFKYWNSTACNSGRSLKVRFYNNFRVPDLRDGPTAEAYDFHRFAYTYINGAYISSSNRCTVWFNDVINNRLKTYAFPDFCTIMVHEVGHLVGQEHSSRAGSVMSATYTPNRPIKVCGKPSY